MGKKCRNNLHELTLVNQSPNGYKNGKKVICCRLCKIKRNHRYTISIKGKLIDKKRYGTKNYKARSFIKNAISNGRLIRTNICSRCHNPGPTQFHHENYELDPLFKNVKEVCLPCHKILDAELKKVNNQLISSGGIS